MVIHVGLPSILVMMTDGQSQNASKEKQGISYSAGGGDKCNTFNNKLKDG